MENKDIFIESPGMYLNSISALYDLLHIHLKQGGRVIEVAYPHFQENDELQTRATKNLKTFKMGSMQIQP